MTQKPQQRRGLGRGLGSLIPTAPVRHDQNAPGAAPGSAGSDGDGATAGAVGTDVHPGLPGQPGAGTPPGETTDPGHGETPSSVSPASEAPAAATDASAATPDVPDTPGGLAPVVGAYFAEIPVGDIAPNPRQPRQVFDEEAMAELVHSVQEVGLLQPVVVRAVGEGRFELIMGERRWRATQEAGLEKIPAIVRETEDQDLLRDALLENLHRSQLNPLEEAAAYQQLLDDFGCTHEELATRIGRSRPQISNTLRLLKLSPPVQRRVAAGVLSAGHARALLTVTDPDVQDRLAARVVAEGISVRALEEIVAVGDLGSGVQPKPRRNKPHAPALDDLAGRLSDRFETRVKVDLGKSKGRVTIEFASIPDLERIVAIMDPRNRDDRPI